MGFRSAMGMDRKLLTLSVVAVSFFLAFLGMRNSYLNGASAPKQRPRAVVESVSKASDLLVEQTNVVAVHPVLPSLPLNGTIGSVAPRACRQILVRISLPSLRFSRAPPLIS